MLKRIIKTIIPLFLVACVITAVGLLGGRSVADASSRFYGIQQTIEKMGTKGYNILEIVPNYNMSSLGFMSSVNNPGISDEIITSFATKQGRIDGLKDVLSPLKNGGYVTYDDSNFYNERIFTTVDDTFKEVSIIGAEDSAYHETRKGNFVLAADYAGAVPNFSYAQKYIITQTLLGATRNGSEVSALDYVPEVNDTIHVQLEISANQDGILNGRSFKANLTNASNQITFTEITNASYSGGVITTNESTASYVSYEYKYTIAAGDVGKEVSIGFSAEDKYYSNLLKLNIAGATDPLTASFESRFVSAPATITKTASDIYQENDKYYENLRFEIVNNSEIPLYTLNFGVAFSSNVTLVPGSEVNCSIDTTDPQKFILTTKNHGDDGLLYNQPYTVEFRVELQSSASAFNNVIYFDEILGTFNVKNSVSEEKKITLKFGDAEREVTLYNDLKATFYVSQYVEQGASLQKYYAIKLIDGAKVYDKGQVMPDDGVLNVSLNNESNSASFVLEDVINEHYNDDYVLDSAAPEYIWVDDPNGTEADIYFDKIYYELNFESTDKFAEDVFELTADDREVRLKESIKVHTYTPTDLEDALINAKISLNNIDLFYISASSALKIPSFITNYTDDNDISYQTAYNMIDYAINGQIPFVIDRSVLSDWSDYDNNLSVTGNPSPSEGANSVNATLNSTGYSEPSVMADIRNRLTYTDETNDGNNILRVAFALKAFATSSALSSLNIASQMNTADVWNADFVNSIVNVGYSGNSNVQYGKYGAIKNSVYINGLRKDGAQVNLANADFGSVFVNYYESYTKDIELDTRAMGLKAVCSEIESDNFYNESTGFAPTSDFTTEGSYKKIMIGQKTLIRYIINYAHRRQIVYKDSIRILDIEPTMYSKLTVDKVKGWISDDNVSQKILNYEIIQMSTAEFNGKIEDIIEQYDMIYIGSCCGDGTSNGSMNLSNGNTVFNDTSMNGLVYYHTGDQITANFDKSHGGMLKGELASDNTSKTSLTTRFIGNDITESKFNDLMKFAICGYPVVVSDKFYSSENKINTSYVDQSSFMYKFMKITTEGGTYNYKVYDENKNQIVKSKSISKLNNVEMEKASGLTFLVRYINMPRLDIALVSKPTEYSITGAVSGTGDNEAYRINSIEYLQPIGGKYYLNYSFEISNSSDSGNGDILYKVRLFTDTNADGKYNDLEELDSLDVTEADTGKPVNYNQLKQSVRYNVSRELPQNFVGMIPWKLQIELSDDTSEFPAKTSKIGYTAIKSNGVTVKVLQIASKQSGGLRLTENFKFIKLFETVKDKMNYDIQVFIINSTMFVENFKKYNNDPSRFFSEYLDQFDMIMIGFVDCYESYTSQSIYDAINLFIAAGKSILFSHDTTSFANSPNAPDWGYNMNLKTRTVVGLDCYGVRDAATMDYTSIYPTISESTTKISQASSDYNRIVENANSHSFMIPYLSDGSISKYAHGFCNYELADFCEDARLKNFLIGKYQQGVGADNTQRWVTRISQVNRGQITTYPFDINIEDYTTRTAASGGMMKEVASYMDIKTTHSQYYAINMNMDKNNDGESDMVVWYALNGGSFNNLPNDAQNAFYIYNCGNITYTGMGHSGATVTWDEAKLFVNTMVAAFNGSIKGPTVTITSGVNDKNTSVQYIYKNFEYEQDKYLDDEFIPAIERYCYVDADNNTLYLKNGEYYYITAPSNTTEYEAETLKYLGDDSNLEPKCSYRMEDEGTSSFAFYVKDVNIVQAAKTLIFKLYTEVTKAEYDSASDKTKYRIYSEGENTYYLKEYVAPASGNPLFTLDQTSPGYLTDGTIANGELLGVTIDRDALESIMLEALNSNDEAAAVRFFVGAYTKLTYAYKVNGTNVTKNTSEAFACVTLKNREMFELD